MMRSHYIFTQLLLYWGSVGKKWVAERGVLDIISVSIVVAFSCCTDLWILLLAGVYMGVSVLIRSLLWG